MARADVIKVSEEDRAWLAPTDDPVTIGAGDAFMGAFLAGWEARGLGREDLARLDKVGEIVHFACRVAAITCTRAGAEPRRLAELALDPDVVQLSR
jgi:fructokinase